MRVNGAGESKKDAMEVKEAGRKSVAGETANDHSFGSTQIHSSKALRIKIWSPKLASLSL